MAHGTLNFCVFIVLVLLWPSAAFFKGGPVELSSQEIFAALWNLARPGPVDRSVWARLTTALEDLYVEDLPESRGLLVLLELLGSPSSKGKEAPPWGFVRDVRRAVRAAVGQTPRHVSFVMIAFLLAIGDKDLMEITRVNMPEPNAFRFDFDRAKLAELHGIVALRDNSTTGVEQLNDFDTAGDNTLAGDVEQDFDSADVNDDLLQESLDDSSEDKVSNADEDLPEDAEGSEVTEDGNSTLEGQHVGRIVEGTVHAKGALKPHPEVYVDLAGIDEEGILLTSRKLYHRLNVGDFLDGLHIEAWDAESGIYKLKRRHVKESHVEDDRISMVQTLAEEVGPEAETETAPADVDGLNHDDYEAHEHGEGFLSAVGATGQIVNQKDAEPNEALQGVEYGWDMTGLAYWMSAMSGDVIGSLAFEFYAMHGLSSAPNFQAVPGAALLRIPLPRSEVSNSTEEDSLEKRCRLVVDLLLPHVQVAAENEFYMHDSPIEAHRGTQHDNDMPSWIALLRLHDAENGEERLSRTIGEHIHKVLGSQHMVPERKEFARYLQYRFGIDNSIDVSMAGTLLLSAAELGDATAQVSVGNVYAGYRMISNVILPNMADGETGVDLERAFYFWQMAAQHGNPSARMMIAQTALAGKHPSISDPTEQCVMALDNCRKCIFEKHPTPLLLHALAKRAHTHDDLAGALVLYSILSEAGSAEAARSAGDLWLSLERHNGSFVPAFPCPAPQSEDAATARVGRPADCALAHFRRAGVLGNVSAMHAAVAVELQRGDLAAAYVWADRAAVSGDEWGAVSRTLFQGAQQKPGAIEELQQLWATPEGDNPTRQQANLAMARQRDSDASTSRSILVAVLVVTVTMLVGMPLACLAQWWKDLTR